MNDTSVFDLKDKQFILPTSEYDPALLHWIKPGTTQDEVRGLASHIMRLAKNYMRQQPPDRFEIWQRFNEADFGLVPEPQSDLDQERPDDPYVEWFPNNEKIKERRCLSPNCSMIMKRQNDFFYYGCRRPLGAVSCDEVRDRQGDLVPEWFEDADQPHIAFDQYSAILNNWQLAQTLTTGSASVFLALMLRELREKKAWPRGNSVNPETIATSLAILVILKAPAPYPVLDNFENFMSLVNNHNQLYIGRRRVKVLHSLMRRIALLDGKDDRDMSTGRLVHVLKLIDILFFGQTIAVALQKQNYPFSCVSTSDPRYFDKSLAYVIGLTRGTYREILFVLPSNVEIYRLGYHETLSRAKQNDRDESISVYQEGTEGSVVDINVPWEYYSYSLCHEFGHVLELTYRVTHFNYTSVSDHNIVFNLIVSGVFNQSYWKIPDRKVTTRPYIDLDTYNDERVKDTYNQRKRKRNHDPSSSTRSNPKDDEDAWLREQIYMNEKQKFIGLEQQANVRKDEEEGGMRSFFPILPFRKRLLLSRGYKRRFHESDDWD